MVSDKFRFILYIFTFIWIILELLYLLRYNEVTSTLFGLIGLIFTTAFTVTHIYAVLYLKFKKVIF
jgi:hypothetical protein